MGGVSATAGGGSGHSCSPPCIMTCRCFLLVSPCQGEPGRFGEPGDPGEDVSRRHTGTGGWLLGTVDAVGGGGNLCPHSPAFPGGLVSSQGAKGSSGAKGEKVSVTCSQGGGVLPSSGGATLGGTLPPAPRCLPAWGHTVCSPPSRREHQVSVCGDRQDRMGLRA